MIEKNQIDLHDLFIKVDNYTEGFSVFLESIEDVEIQPEWMDELAIQLSYLPSEIAFWKESDVRSQVLSFYVRKTKPVTPTPPIPTPPDPTIPGPVNPPVTPVPVDNGLVDQAKGCIHKAVMPNMFWQKVMLDLLEEHPEVAKFITENLNM